MCYFCFLFKVKDMSEVVDMICLWASLCCLHNSEIAVFAAWHPIKAEAEYGTVNISKTGPEAVRPDGGP